MSFFPLRFLSAFVRRPRGRRNVGEGSEYLSTIIIAACVMYHVVLQADSSVYIRIHGGLAELPSKREKERKKDDGPSDTRARPCISRRFGRAGHYRRRNKSKPRERERPGHLLFAAERESFINLRARTTYSREQEALCHLVLLLWEDASWMPRKVRVPAVLLATLSETPDETSVGESADDFWLFHRHGNHR